MKTIRFEEISIKATRKWIDPSTGKKRQETKKFWQTMSPFNKDEHGVTKNGIQIMNEIRAERDTWLASHKED